MNTLFEGSGDYEGAEFEDDIESMNIGDLTSESDNDISDNEDMAHDANDDDDDRLTRQLQELFNPENSIDGPNQKGTDSPRRREMMSNDENNDNDPIIKEMLHDLSKFSRPDPKSTPNSASSSGKDSKSFDKLESMENIVDSWIGSLELGGTSGPIPGLFGRFKEQSKK